ncbi:MAG: FkbM family methyltransferase [Syntrophothermus sp.]
MLKIKELSFIKRKFKGLLLHIYNIMENNDNCDFNINGEKFLVDQVLSLFKDKIQIFDIGANIGNYSQMLISECNQRGLDYKIHIFEPTNPCIKILEEKFKTNNKIIINKFGVSNKSIESTIYYDAETSGFSSLYQRDLKSENVELNIAENIKLKRLDEYIRENDIQKINFIKIDIEGHEIAAFNGLGEYLNNDFIDIIQFEYGSTNLDSRTNLLDFYKLFESRGFEILKIRKKYLERRIYNRKHDTFQYSNFVAISKKLLVK